MTTRTTRARFRVPEFRLYFIRTIRVIRVPISFDFKICGLHPSTCPNAKKIENRKVEIANCLSNGSKSFGSLIRHTAIAFLQKSGAVSRYAKDIDE
jgi:hypothetical protein